MTHRELTMLSFLGDALAGTPQDFRELIAQARSTTESPSPELVSILDTLAAELERARPTTLQDVAHLKEKLEKADEARRRAARVLGWGLAERRP